MLTRLFVMSIVANNLRGFSLNESMRAAEWLSSSSKSLSWLRSSEKKATSEPLIKAEQTNNARSNNTPPTNPQ